MPPRALITDATLRNSLAILRAIAPDMEADITASYARYLNLCKYSKHMRTLVSVGPTGDAERYGRRLVEVLRSRRYDYFLPVGLSSCVAASMFKEEISPLANCLLPDWKDMQVAYNKDRTMELAERIGVPTPRTVEISDSADLERLTEFPIVLKASEQSSVRYCQDIEGARAQYSQLVGSSRSMIIAQEYITGYGCGFYGVYREGRLMDFYLHQRLREFPTTGGSSAMARSYRSERLFELGKRMGDALNWNGPIMVEFKRDRRTGDYKLMEVNPKLWGSLDLTLAAGIDIPHLIFSLADGAIDGPIASRYEDAHYGDVTFRWPLPDQLKVFCVRPSLGSAKELLLGPGRTNLSITDPAPGLFMLALGILQGFKVLVNENERYPHGRGPTT